MQPVPRTAERILSALLLGGIGIGCLFVLWPFFSAILWAAILTYTTWPIYEWLCSRSRFGRTGAAAAMVLIAFVVVVLPIALAVPGSAEDVDRLRRLIQDALAAGLPASPEWLRGLPAVGPSLARIWDTWAADLSAMVEFFRPYFGVAAEFGLSLLLGLANGVLMFLLALVVAFFLFASGERLAPRIEVLLGRIAGTRAPRLIAVTGATVRGVVYGILGTAIVQGHSDHFRPVAERACPGRCCSGWWRAAFRCCPSARRWCGSRPRCGCSARATRHGASCC